MDGILIRTTLHNFLVEHLVRLGHYRSASLNTGHPVLLPILPHGIINPPIHIKMRVISVAKFPLDSQFPAWGGALQKMIELQRRITPLVEPMVQISPMIQGMGAIADLGQYVMAHQPAIEALEAIQSNARIGMLSEAEFRASGFSVQELAAMVPPPAAIEAASIIRQFDTAIGEMLPGQMALQGFRSSWPAIDAFNNQMAILEEQGIPYAQIRENLRQSDFFQRNHDLLVSPAVKIYETCGHLPVDVAGCARILDGLSSIESIISSFSGNLLFSRLSPILDTILDTPPDVLFWREHQRKCLRALMEAKWCPSLLFDIPEQEMIPLNRILTKKASPDERVEAIDKFVFRRFGRDYIAGILEDWASLPIPPHVQQLMSESVKAYRRKEYGLVVHSLPVQWEGIIKEKAHLPERVSGAILKDAVEKLVSENSRSKILSAFYEDFVMYQCYGMKDYIPDVPGRNAIAHGWFPEYPSRKAALNAILFTDFLLHLDKLEETAA